MVDEPLWVRGDGKMPATLVMNVEKLLGGEMTWRTDVVSHYPSRQVLSHLQWWRCIGAALAEGAGILKRATGGHLRRQEKETPRTFMLDSAPWGHGQESLVQLDSWNLIK